METVGRNEWEKELRVLLDKVQNNPSADLTAERERINVLNKLIAGHVARPVDA